jgi:hypothetical protein
LSYSRFRYSGFLWRKPPATGVPHSVSARVSNVSARDGDEVVQLYLAVDGGLPALAAFQRVHIAAGRNVLVRFTLNADATPAGRVKMWIGGGPPLAGMPSAESTVKASTAMCHESRRAPHGIPAKNASPGEPISHNPSLKTNDLTMTTLATSDIMIVGEHVFSPITSRVAVRGRPSPPARAARVPKRKTPNEPISHQAPIVINALQGDCEPNRTPGTQPIFNCGPKPRPAGYRAARPRAEGRSPACYNFI